MPDNFKEIISEIKQLNAALARHVKADGWDKSSDMSGKLYDLLLENMSEEENTIVLLSVGLLTQFLLEQAQEIYQRSLN